MALIPASDLRPACDPGVFEFETTAEVEPYVGLIGQQRAVDAIKFGLSIESNGFNICVTGDSGTGRTTAVREYLEAFAEAKAPPNEWCYVNNFEQPLEPKALSLPDGKGRQLKTAMTTMVAEARVRIPQTFESDDYSKRRDEIIRSVQRYRERAFSEMAERARTGGFLLQGNPAGFFLLPIAGGREGDQPLDDQAFARLSQAERTALLQRRDQLMEELSAVMKEAQNVEAAATERLLDLQRTIATTVVDALMDHLFEEFENFVEVVRYLDRVRRDMIDHIDDFFRRPDVTHQGPGMMPVIFPPQVSPFRKYEVNLIVDAGGLEHAPVVFEPNPTPQRLFGKIEKEAMFGAVTSDFTMTRAGSLHKANGGYLVIDFDDLLLYPLSYQELKRTISTGQLTIEEMGERLGYIETKTVRPEPIPWTGKIVAIAREMVYRTLYTLDPDFRELFKVKADFDMHIDRSVENERAYAGLVAAVTKRESLPALDRGAVASIVDQGVRLADDHNKLSVRFGELTDLVREAAHWAQADGTGVVTREHIRRAVLERTHRVNLIEEHIREAMVKGVIVVETAGAEVGQVNGLSVIDLGDTAFGQPSRITATMGVGREGIIDLQREARLSGPIHSKAVLTLQGFLVDRYASQTPLTLAARLAFEQSYGMVEGDSATVAETCALLSRIADVPLKQSLAITGSMDQRGDVQAIGGANQKIEGFFDYCRVRGLSGEQGVIIPASNVQHLMLREDVVEAVKAGSFAVHAVSTIDEALELLTGVEAGAKREDGTYAPESLNGRVLARLHAISERLRQLAARPDEEERAKAPAAEREEEPS